MKNKKRTRQSPLRWPARPGAPADRPRRGWWCGARAVERWPASACRARCLVQPAVPFFKQKTAYEIRPRDWSSDVCSSDLYLFTKVKRNPRIICLCEYFFWNAGRLNHFDPASKVKIKIHRSEEHTSELQ